MSSGSQAEQEFKGTGRFAIRRRLGAGGFGVVYEAFDRKRNQLVALKTLLRMDPASLYRFKQEFRSLADISHPNLAALYELLFDGREWFFTMELVDGVNLLVYVREEGCSGVRAEKVVAVPPLENFATTAASQANWGITQATDTPLLPESGLEAPLFTPGQAAPPVRIDRLRDAFAQLAEGVYVLHQHGILHRDIKPSNVLVDLAGRVVLLDFGLASQLVSGHQMQTMHVAGTPAYMAPEQGAWLPVSEASDWYCVGAMLFEALTGRLPFTGTMSEILGAKQTGNAPPPAELAPGIPEDLNELCADLLRRDPAARPSGREVLQRLGAKRPSRVLPGEAAARRTLPLVGRKRHLRALHQALEESKVGRAITVLVHGHSGLGKTVLVRRFLEDLRERDSNVVLLAGRCYEQESVPYKALDSLVDALSQYLKRLPSAEAARLMPRDVLALARLFPVLHGVEVVATGRRRVLEIPDFQELRRRAFGALRELLARLADERPVVLFIDDLQWGDLDSGALLAELMRPPDAPALLLVVSYRSEEVESSPLLQRFLPSQKALGCDRREVEIGELSQEEARELAQALLGLDQPDAAGQAETIARESGGNPFFLYELVRYAASQEKTEWQAATLGDVIRGRVSHLPEEARRLLEVVAVAGQPVEMGVAVESAGLSQEQAILSLLRREHLVRTRVTGERTELEAYHDRIRETLLEGLSRESLGEYHHRLAVALEAAEGIDPETLAVHFQGAGDARKAARYCVQAADKAAEALAFDRAARLYRQALAFEPLEGAEARGLQVKLGDALSNAGRGAEAARVYLAAAEGTEAGQALELRRRATEQLLNSGHIDEGLEVLRTVLGMVGMKMPKTPRRAFLALLVRRAQIRLRGLRFQERPADQIPADVLMRIDTCWSVARGLGIVDVIRGGHFGALHLLLALRAGEPYRAGRALAGESGFSAVRGGRSRRRTAELLRMTTELAERLRHPHLLALARFEAGLTAFLQGEFEKSREASEQAQEMLLQCTGVTWELDSARLFSLLCLHWLGEWRELARRVPVLIREAEERGDLYSASYLRTRLVHPLSLAADNPEHAWEEQSRASQVWPHQHFDIRRYWGLFVQVEVGLYRGEALAPWKLIREWYPALHRSLLENIQCLYIESRHMRARTALALAAAGMPKTEEAPPAGELLKQAARDARSMEGEKMPWGNALALVIRAGIAAAQGNAQAALALAVSAEQALEECHMRLLAAAMRRRRGELLGGEPGRTFIESADAWMAGQGIKNPARLAAMFVPGNWQAPG